MSKATHCPYCWCFETVFTYVGSVDGRSGEQVTCKNCGSAGPIMQTQEEAVVGWNGVAERVDFSKRIDKSTAYLDILIEHSFKIMKSENEKLRDENDRLRSLIGATGEESAK